MKAFLVKHYSLLAIALGTAAIGFSFYLGYLEGKQQGSEGIVFACSDNILKQLTVPTAALSSELQSPIATTGPYFGSKNGTKYYASECKDRTRIKSENIVWFAAVEDAEIQGYTKATSC